MLIGWLARSITPRIAAQQLVTANIIRPPAEELLEQLEANWQTNHDPSSTLSWLLGTADRLTGFDCETSSVPVDYVVLVEDLIKISADVFQVEAVSQQVAGEYFLDRPLRYDVQFVYNHKVHHFQPEDCGDWYDVSAVMQALNLALAEAQRPERFLLLHTGDQTCMVTFAPEKAFQEVAAQLCMPIERNLHSAMDEGVAYEQYVRQASQEGSLENRPT